MRKGQAITLEAVLALFLAILFSYLLLGTGTKARWDMRMERAGYDIMNALYLDAGLHGAIEAGAERRFYDGSQISYVQLRLSRLARDLELSRIEVSVGAYGRFTGVNSQAPEGLNKQTFYGLLPLDGGLRNEPIEVVIWI